MSLQNLKKQILSLNLVVIILFILLIYKAPFSQRTLISNFEPYPDTFFYINPALSLVRGEGFNINRNGRIIKLSVPPLYSLTLTPAFIFKQDPRMSYYTNVLLALVSLFLFRAILKKLFTNKLIIFSLLFLYITNYFIYWVPSLVMAENLTLPLYLAGIFLLLSKTTIISSVIVSFLAVAVYATKYANIPVTLSFIFLYLVKFLFAETRIVQKVRTALPLLGAFVFFYLILAVIEEFLKGKNIFTQMFEHLYSIYYSVPKTSIQTSKAAASSWFGLQYVAQNLPQYINSLMGVPNRFLWDQTPLVPKVVAVFGLVGLLGGLLFKKVRYIAFSLTILLSTTVIFMSTFYSFDARYIYIAIPSLIIGFGLFLNGTESIFRKSLIFNIIIFVFIAIYITTSFTRIKSQISLNLRYAETPWNYISVLKLNEYFTADKVADGKKPILISALPPFLVDYYSNGNYTLLPLSYEQEFRGDLRQAVWGPNDYDDLPKLYRKYIDEGYNIYVSRAGLGNEGYTNRDFNAIIKDFDTKLVLPGCYDQCNIYSVKLKEKNAR